MKYRGRIQALSLEHSMTVFHRREDPTAQWSYMVLERIEGYQGHKKLEWLNSELDAACQGLVVGDAVIVETNRWDIPTSIQKFDRSQLWGLLCP